MKDYSTFPLPYELEYFKELGIIVDENFIRINLAQTTGRLPPDKSHGLAVVHSGQ